MLAAAISIIGAITPVRISLLLLNTAPTIDLFA
jgi:hypothetical protein